MKNKIKAFYLILNDFFKVLEKKDQFKFFYFLFFSVLNTLLEISSLFLLINLLFIIAEINTGTSEIFEVLYWLINRSPILYSTILMLSVVIFKFMFQTIYSYEQERFGYNVQKKISQKVYNTILNSEYLDYLKFNSSNITRMLNSDLIRINNQLISPIISILNELLLIVSICLLIFTYNFLLGISTLLFSIAIIFVFILSINKKLKFYSKESILYSTKMIKHILESHKAYLTVNLFGVKTSFVEKFDAIIDKYVKYGHKTIFLLRLPKNLFELIIFLSISILIFTLYFLNKTELIVEYIGILSVATFKLIPSLNKLSTSIQAIQYFSKPFTEILFFLKLKNVETNSFKKIENFQKIKYNNLSFSYDGGTKVLGENNLEIFKNDFIGIVGESGSGKSTLINLLSGLIYSKNIEVILDDCLIQSHELRSLCSIVQQETVILDQNIYVNIALEFDSNKIDKYRINNLLKQVNLYHPLKDKLDQSLGENGNKLSGGQKQRIGIARALFFNKKILILDESTSSLDLMNQRGIIDLLYNLKRKITIIFISHNKENLINCDKILEVNQGKIITLK